jgi:hypothetical protein
MNVKFIKSLTICCFTFVLFIGISPLHAYVLQGKHVLDLVIEKLGPADSLFVTERLVLYRMSASVEKQGAEASEDIQPSAGSATEISLESPRPETDQQTLAMEELELERSLRYIFPRAFRSDTRSPDSERIFIAVGGRTLTIVDGYAVPDGANRFDLYKDVLLYRTRDALADRLLQLGVDVSISSLGRFEDKIAFVLGAKYPDDTVNQLWIDKNTLMPFRLIIGDAYGADVSDKTEIRYLIWWKVGETHYPSKIEFYQGENLVQVSQAKNFEENATFSEELFNIDHLKTVYPQAPMQPTATEAVEEPSEIQKTIEDFKKIFE